MFFDRAGVRLLERAFGRQVEVTRSLQIKHKLRENKEVLGDGGIGESPAFWVQKGDLAPSRGSGNLSFSTTVVDVVQDAKRKRSVDSAVRWLLRY